MYIINLSINFTFSINISKNTTLPIEAIVNTGGKYVSNFDLKRSWLTNRKVSTMRFYVMQCACNLYHTGYSLNEEMNFI